VVLDPRNPQVFFVTPPATAADVIRLDLVIQPLGIDLGDDLPIDQKYFGALHNYLMFRCYARDTEYAAQGGRAMLHWGVFLSEMGASGDGADS